ncbi:hypothetical protein BDFB_002292 [Asbolus verrucosus]|uniref:Uncharacterized protein n=1 Tax=Asbolus verrucosus TaxID=1661398 RepID=A0A482W5C0_ASBVE|nr:hypothetical protein BDFB_002292 [Asbolus verrucosus]
MKAVSWVIEVCKRFAWSSALLAMVM